MQAMFQTIQRHFARPLRFGAVGVSGVLVNTAVLWLLAQGAGLPAALASAIATEAAILSNFVLNDRWTFQSGTHRLSGWQRLVRYNGVALGGLVITTGLLTLLMAYTPLHLLAANLLAIGVATVWNYVVSSRWTWNTPRGAHPTWQEPRSHVARHTSQAASDNPTRDLRLATRDLDEVTV